MAAPELPGRAAGATRSVASARPARSRFTRTVALLCTALHLGCYSYVPVRGEPASRGAGLRVHLATPGDFRLSNVTANNITVLEGEVIRWSDAELALSAFGVRSATGYEMPAVGETVVIPTRDIASVERKKVSWLRSAAVAGLALLAGALGAVVLSGGGGDPGDSGGGPQPK